MSTIESRSTGSFLNLDATAASQQRAALEQWLLPPIPPRPHAEINLWCFSFAGGGPSSFREWRKNAPAWLGVHAVLLPGRERRNGEAPFTEMEPLVDAAVAALAPAMTARVAFFGYSMGALVAFELARAFRSLGLPQPAHLFATAHRAPQIPDPLPELYLLPDAELKCAVKERFGQVNDALDHPELCELLLPVLRADLSVCKRYQYRPEAPLECPVSVLGAEDDAIVDPSSLRAWAGQSSQPVAIKLFQGGHFFMQQHPDAVFDWVLQRLLQSRQPGGAL